MNQLTTATVTMTSLEISELTGKRHDNVLADIRTMLAELGLMSPDFSGHIKIPMPRGGEREIEVFKLPKRECLILVSGYSLALRAKIIDRWQELEAQVSQPAFVIPQTLPDALRLAADLADKVQEQAKQIEADAPHVNFSKVIENSKGAIPIGVFAKLMGIKGLGTNQKARYRAH